jgi:hypothetical protein
MELASCVKIDGATTTEAYLNELQRKLPEDSNEYAKRRTIMPCDMQGGLAFVWRDGKKVPNVRMHPKNKAGKRDRD